MSDFSTQEPVVRRSRAVKALISCMRGSKSGWTEADASRFLIEQYGYGLRKHTAVGILRELAELGVLYITGRSPNLIYHLKKG